MAKSKVLRSKVLSVRVSEGFLGRLRGVQIERLGARPDWDCRSVSLAAILVDFAKDGLDLHIRRQQQTPRAQSPLPPPTETTPYSLNSPTPPPPRKKPTPPPPRKKPTPPPPRKKLGGPRRNPPFEQPPSPTPPAVDQEPGPMDGDLGWVGLAEKLRGAETLDDLDALWVDFLGQDIPLAHMRALKRNYTDCKRELQEQS